MTSSNLLGGIRFTGDVRAVEEGSDRVSQTNHYSKSPSNLIEAQIVETMLLNIVTTASLLATKASRLVQARRRGRPIIDFGSRRTHGEDAALQAARSSYIAGFAGTSNVKAAAMFGIPAFGTMAHSFVQAFERRKRSLQAAYADRFPDKRQPFL